MFCLSYREVGFHILAQMPRTHRLAYMSRGGRYGHQLFRWGLSDFPWQTPPGLGNGLYGVFSDSSPE